MYRADGADDTDLADEAGQTDGADGAAKIDGADETEQEDPADETESRCCLLLSKSWYPFYWQAYRRLR